MNRLALLLETTKAIPEDHFNMGSFFEGVDDVKEGTKLLKDCGTSGCVIGWACCHPKFVGLRKRLQEDWFNAGYSHYVATLSFAKYFGISRHQAEELFFNFDQTKQEAIKRIERLLCK